MRGAVEELETMRDKAMENIEANLTDAQLEEIKAAVAATEESMDEGKAQLQEVIAQAKADAESALEQLKEELIAEHKAVVTIQ